MHVLTPAYLINIATLIIYLQLSDSNTVFEKLPLSSTIGLFQCFANVLEDDHQVSLWIYFIESPFLLQCAVDADLVECNSNTVTATPTLFNSVTYHLKMVNAVIRLWGLTKLVKKF